jgi:hypothetical protein
MAKATDGTSTNSLGWLQPLSITPLVREREIAREIDRRMTEMTARSQPDLAAKGHRAIQKRKAEQNDFERKKAFEHFRRMPRRTLDSQHAASCELDKIADIFVALPGGRRSKAEARRRVGRLRREFLRLPA